MDEEKRPTGRPRIFQTPEAFDAAVDTYVAICQATESRMTWTGLALALGFSSRQSIDEYLGYDGFSDSVKRAKLYVENGYEEMLADGKPVGAIFALKNMGWRDRQELGVTDGDGKSLFGGLADAIRSTTRAAMLRDETGGDS